MHSQWPMGLKALASPPQSHTAHSPPATGYLWGSSHLSRVTCHACCRTETIRHFLAPPIRGVVLQCYGAGNMPSNREDH